MCEVQIISGYEPLLALEPVWADVAARGGGAGAFEPFALVREAAAMDMRAGGEPMVAAVLRDGVPVTLLPLRRERMIGVRTAVPLVAPLAQYADTIGLPLSPADMPDFCAALSRHGLDVLIFRKVREDGGLYDALSYYGHPQNAHERALFIDLDGYRTFDAYDASFSGATRRNRRQRKQKLESQRGALSFSILRGAEALPAFELALDWKRQWLAQRGTSSAVFDGGPWEGLLRSTVASGAAIVSVLAAGGVPAAVEIGYEDRASYLSYLGAFDPELSSFSPGQEQMLRTIAWCFARGFARYDLLAPADDYKLQWTRTGTGVAINDYALPLTHVGRGAAELRRHVRPLARDVYLRLSPEMRTAGGRYGVPAAAALAAMCAGAVMAAIE